MTQHPDAPAMVEDWLSYFRQYEEESIADLARGYPRDQRSLHIDFSDVYSFSINLADDLRDQPRTVLDCAEEALRRFDLPVDVGLGRAKVRIYNLPETRYPGELSPARDKGHLFALEGEVSKATDVYAMKTQVAWECQRCGTLTTTLQRNRDGRPDDDLQEPFECDGCERQGPFEQNHAQSSERDAQMIRLRTPPEAKSGSGETIDVMLYDDLVDRLTAGDRTIITGIMWQQQISGSKNKYLPLFRANHVNIKQRDAHEVTIGQSDRERIRELANGANGDPLELAAESFCYQIHGEKTVKKALLLATVGGSQVKAPTVTPETDTSRGEFHVLLIGDPATGKSKLIQEAGRVGWRGISISGTGATKAGVTATAVKDDFGDGTWTLEAGALVEAHKGIAAIDELDDMPAEVRSALLEPMSTQTISINKGGINTTLQTKAAIVAAANPDLGRFDPYQPIAEQFVFSSTLLSRFDLVYTFTDQPDTERDEQVADWILQQRDLAAIEAQGQEIPDDYVDPHPPIDRDLLRCWVALAKQQPTPTFETDAVRDKVKDAWTELRGLYGYDDPDNPVPVTYRSLEGIIRIAEAAAKFELSDTITDRHAQIAIELVGESMKDIGRDPDTGKFDADIVETGCSQSQKQRKTDVRNVIMQLMEDGDDDTASIDDIVDEVDAGRRQVESDINNMLQKGIAIERSTGEYRLLQ